MYEIHVNINIIYIYIQWYTYDVYNIFILFLKPNQNLPFKNVGGFSNHPWTTIIIDPTPISSDDVLAAAVYKHLSSGEIGRGTGGGTRGRNQPGKPAHLLKKNIGSWWVFMSLYLLDDLRLFLKVGEKTLKFLAKMME